MSCTGLTEEELLQKASDKHLIRLAAKVGIGSFRHFVIYLGLTRDEWEETEYSYKSPDAIKFMALHKWRGKKEADQSPGTLKDLLFGLQEIEDNRHHLCQIFRERTEFLGVPQIIPDDDMLWELSRKVGNCVIQLGIELGLEVTEVEQTIYAYPKDLFQQIYDILRKCRDKNKANTLYMLMRSLQRVNSQAVTLLIKKYDIKTSSKPGEHSSQERSSYEEKGAIPKRSKPISQTGLPTRHHLMEAGFRGEESKLETKQSAKTIEREEKREPKKTVSDFIRKFTGFKK